MVKKTYFIKYNGEVYVPKLHCNHRGFTYEEAMQCIQRENWQNADIISIEEEIEKYNLQGDPFHKLLLNPENYVYDTWNCAYMDNNINGMSLPICIDTNEEYMDLLQDVYQRYINEVNKPAFAYEDGLVAEIATTCSDIVSIMKLLIGGETDSAEQRLKNMVEKFSEDPFFVSELDKCYSFRGIAPFVDLQRNGHESLYEEMNSQQLTFYRVRTKCKASEEDISKQIHIVHLPFDSREKASSMRFNSAGSPCLYLGTTSYVCSKECNWKDDAEEIFASCFIPNKAGRKLRILNLTVSQALINGIYHKSNNDSKEKYKLQLKMLKIFPLVIATSFSIKDENRKVKYEYLISQSLMRVINEIGINGIAYLSMKGKNEFQYPQGINLALPALDITEKKQYSDICNMFDISLPVKFDNQTLADKKSYINAVYKKTNEWGGENYMSKADVDGEETFYGDTKYGKFDDYLASQPMGRFEALTEATF